MVCALLYFLQARSRAFAAYCCIVFSIIVVSTVFEYFAEDESLNMEVVGSGVCEPCYKFVIGA
jgi:hypothetical protein